jgi:hypothetical protein
MLDNDVHFWIAQCRHHPLNVRLGNECARRTARYALSAVDATRYIHSFVKGSTDGCFGAAIDEVDASNALYFIANADAFSAFNTFFGIANDGFAGRINRMMVALSDEPSLADSKRFGKFPELTVAISFAEEAIVGVIGEEQFDDHSSGIDNAVGLGFDF